MEASSSVILPIVGWVGWFVSPMFSKLLDYIILRLTEKKELPKDVERLHDVLLQINDIIEEAEEKQFTNSAVRQWLRKLKEVVYDVEDSLQMSEVSNVPVAADQIKARSDELEVILKLGVDFGLHHIARSSPQIHCSLNKKRETTSMLEDISVVFGRANVKNEIIKQLVVDKEHNRGERIFAVLPIVGMGGLGKTSLAQLVFNDRQVVDHYKSRAWVYLGASRDFDVNLTMANIIESIWSFQNRNEKFMLSTFDALSLTLYREIKEPFLLVLDDAWNPDSINWDKLLRPLKAKKIQCRVIVTTRDKKVANAFLDRLEPIELDFLEEEDMRRTFERFAFGNGNASKHPVLETIGRDIVRRLKGLPLAATTIGRILHGNRDERHWRRILESEQLLNYNREENFMLPTLMMSYQSLPVILKQFFSYFSLFPKDYKFIDYATHNRYKESLCEMKWAVQRSEQFEVTNLESNASDYVGGLLSRSLLQYMKSDSHISIHDLVHEMAELIGKEEILRVSNAARKKQIPMKIRHISYFQQMSNQDSFLLKELHGRTSLRTLIYHNLYERIDNCLDDLTKCFTMTSLRVLSLRSNYITELPKSIGDLKLLRLLDLFLPEITCLPEEISQLCSLQDLCIRGSNKMHALPSSITELVNLIHLDVQLNWLKAIIGIGKLTKLQKLEEFYVGKDAGHEVTELRNLDGLRDSLKIFYLENIKDKENAQQARLEQKKNLEKLELAWGTAKDSEKQSEVLAALCPSTNLKKLLIRGYEGTLSPSWLNSKSLPFLNCLEIWACPNLSKIPSLPLTLLHFGLHNTGVESLVSSEPTSPMPSLQHLEVTECSKLDVSLNSLLKSSSSSLGSLKIINYHSSLEELDRVTNLSKLELRRCKSKIILNCTALRSLTQMEIINCREAVIKGLSCDADIVSSLTSITIAQSPKLLELFSPGNIVCLGSLEKLHIDFSDSIEVFDSMQSYCRQWETTLKVLDISNYQGSLLELSFLESLEKLSIKNCSNISLPFLSSLKNVEICRSNITCQFGEVLDPFPSLERVHVEEITSQQFIDLMDGFKLSPIKTLIIEECDDLKNLDNELQSAVSALINSLEWLQFESCSNLSNLPAYLEEFQALKFLIISKSSSLLKLPVGNFPISLQVLQIVDCPDLEARYGNGGTDHFMPEFSVCFLKTAKNKSNFMD